MLLIGCTSQKEQVDVRLKWLHQAQFAGMYVAKEKGFYEDVGIDVALEQFNYGDSQIDEVAGGEKDFGITGADELLIAREKGAKVKAVAVIYKKNPVVLYSLKSSGILTPKDLVGKRVGIEKGINVEYVYRTMLSNLEIDSSSIIEVEIGYDDSELVSGDVDVSTGYVINEPQLAIEKGYELNYIFPSDYGVNMYADVLIASEDMIEENPGLVRRFVFATLKGWEYAIENEEEAVQAVLIYADSSYLHQKNMLASSYPLIISGNEGIGIMEEESWYNTYEFLKANGMLTGEYVAPYTNEFVKE
jgi:ABC-type nitrate/sulfonate/bicarbonate transport system substrate-binding protein